jgi:hypothetical protein
LRSLVRAGTPCALRLAPCALRLAPCALHLAPCTRVAIERTLHSCATTYVPKETNL